MNKTWLSFCLKWTRSVPFLRSPYLLLGLMCLLVFGLNAGGLMLYGLDETKNAECAREMLARQDWVVPTFNGQLRTDKPVLHYYGMMLAYQLLGINEWSARLGSLMCGGLMVLLTYAFAQRFFSPRIGWMAATVLLASIHVAIQFRMSVPDPYLIFWQTLALMSFWYGYSHRTDNLIKSRNGFLLFYTGIAFSVLAKGPVGIVLPALILVLFFLLTGTIRSRVWQTQTGSRWPWMCLPSLHGLHVWKGVAIFLVIVFPWYLAVHLQTHGAWTKGFFLEHNLSRYGSSMEGHGGLFLVTPAYVLIGLLPFSVFLPQGYFLAWKQRRQHPALLFAWVCVSVVTGFFMFSATKLPNYTVPAYPFAALLIAFFLDHTLQSHAYEKLKVGMYTYLVLMLLLPVGIYQGLYYDASLTHLSTLAFKFITFPVGALLAWFFYRRRQWSAAYHTVLASFLLTTCILFADAYPKVDQENPVAQTRDLFPGTRMVVAYKQFNPAYVYYLKRIIPVVHTPASLSRFMLAHPEAIIITREEFLHEIAMVAPWQLLKKRRDTFESPTTVILQQRQLCRIPKPNRQLPSAVRQVRVNEISQ